MEGLHSICTQAKNENHGMKKTDVDGYQVQVARDTKFKKGKKVVNGEKIYSDWSVPKKF